MRPIVKITGEVFDTPLFLPVFEPGNAFIDMNALKDEFPVRGIITNGFLLYRRRDVRAQVQAKGIKEFLGFNGLVMTDSGAFQGLSRTLYLSNRDIVRFQQDIGVDIVSPLDIITPPGDNWQTAQRKLNSTMKRILEASELTDRALLAMVQQGGRFLDLRAESARRLNDLQARYVALGSLVPFLNRNHDITFVGKVIRQAREILPDGVVFHLYGAGDPLELPFFIAIGCDVFDSSSFVHYARGGWYMTPYGAITKTFMSSRGGYCCQCPYCRHGLDDVWSDAGVLAKHNLWTIFDTIQRAAEMHQRDTLCSYLDEVLAVHQDWFPESRLKESWRCLASNFEGL